MGEVSLCFDGLAGGVTGWDGIDGAGGCLRGDFERGGELSSD